MVLEAVNEISLPALDDQNRFCLPISWHIDRPADFPFRSYPRIGVDIELENRSRSSHSCGLNYPDHYGCSALDVSSAEGAAWLDHGTRGDDAVCRLQRGHGGSKPLRAFWAIGFPPLPVNSERDDFTDSQLAIFPFADLPKSSSSIGLEIGNIGANKEESP